jgi:putative adenylate-forming enzyme
MSLLQHLADLIRLNWHFYHFSARQIACYQEKAVLGLIARVQRDSPYYRDLYAGQAIVSLRQYSQLPSIGKPVMMANFDRLNTAGLKRSDVTDFALAKEMAGDYLGYYQDRYVIGLSSGTSGNKGIYVTDRQLTQRLPGVFLARGGVRLSELPLRILFILRVFSQGFADINAPLIKLRYLPSMTEPAAIIDMFNQMRANILMAPPSLLRQLLPLSGKIARPPRRIITYAEVLEPEEKQRIAAAFGAPVVEIYQASEGQIASPCRCGNLHINEDLVYVELLGQDGQPVGQPGQRASRMLVTNLVNTVQPLLRYEMNDIIELGGQCPCGSHFRMIARIVGRNDDVLELATRNGGRRAVFPDLVSRWIITTDDRIREFQVTQDAADHLAITLDLGGLAALDPVAVDIVENLQTRFARELAAFDIECLLSIEVQPILLPADNRKMKRFVRLKQKAALDSLAGLVSDLGLSLDDIKARRLSKQ